MIEELEILKLKKMLEKAKIPFKFTDDFFHGYHNPSYQIVIYDKKNKKSKLCDVIYHFGSYGYDKNLLEIMGALTKEESDSSVLGYLTADEVFKRFKYCYEHNTNIYVMEENNNGKEFEEALNETVNKFASVILQANHEQKNATNLVNAIDYLERTPQIRALRKYCLALKLIKTKSKKNYNLALVVDSGTYEQYCKQFEYFLNDYKEKGGAFEIWEDDRFSFEEYNLLREVFAYE